MKIILEVLKRFKPETTCGDILKMQQNGDIDIYQFVEDLIELGKV